MHKDLIDSEFLSGWENFIFSEDEIKWRGKPNFEFTSRILEGDNHHDVVTGLTSILTLYMMFIGVLFYLIYSSGFEIIAIIGGIIGVIFPFVFDYIKYKNNQKTEYAITDKYVLFKFYNIIDYKVKALPISSICKTHVVESQDGKGTIYLISNQKESFSTYDGKTMKKQDHITLEYLKEYRYVNSMLGELIKENNLKVEIYKEPVVGGKIVKFTKVALAIIIGFLSIYTVDYYAIPTIYRESKVAKQFSWKKYETLNGYKFNLYKPARILNKNVVFQTTRIFRTVKQIRLESKEHIMQLSSGLGNKIFIVVFYIFFLINIGCFLKLYGKERIRKIEFIRILIATIATFLILWTIWYDLNGSFF